MIMEQKEKLISEKSYYSFFRCCWEILYPQDIFYDNWHYEILCDELQKQIERIAKGKEKEYDLLINIPPRSAKSTLVTIALIAWAWIHYPNLKFLTASYDGTLALEHAVATRRLIKSDWYQYKWGDRFQFVGDQNIKSFYETDKRGYRIATSVGGSGTGRGGDIIIVDDPISAQGAESEVTRKACIDWWTKTMFSRLNNQKVGLRIVVMQRLHEDDLSGFILSQTESKYKYYILPVEEADNIRPITLRKKYVNGLLFPEMFDKKMLKDVKYRLGSYTYAGQYMQTPSPEGGGMFQRVWWRFWKPKNMKLPSVQTRTPDGVVTHPMVNLPDEFDDLIISWDCTFKNSKGSDRVAGGVWGLLDVDKFLLDQSLDNRDFVETKNEIQRLSEKNPDATAILIEDKANGPAVISELKNQISGIIPVNPLGSKTSRVTDASKAMSVVAQCEAGNIYLPHPAIAPWVNDFIEEFALFPNGKYDDQVDQTSQAINHFSEHASRPGIAGVK